MSRASVDVEGKADAVAALYQRELDGSLGSMLSIKAWTSAANADSC